MKISVNMKTPDCLEYATEHLSEEEKEKVMSVAKRWFEFGESVTLEIDTDAETCVVT
jgi:hypothetical protein